MSNYDAGEVPSGHHHYNIDLKLLCNAVTALPVFNIYQVEKYLY